MNAQEFINNGGDPMEVVTRECVGDWVNEWGVVAFNHFTQTREWGCDCAAIARAKDKETV